MATTCKLIGKTTLTGTAATVSLGSIPATYDDLLVVWSVRGDRAVAAQLFMIGFNSSTSNFTNRVLSGNGASASSTTNSDSGRYLGEIPGSTATADTFANGECYIPNYAASTNKAFSSTNAQETNGSTAYLTAVAGLWSNSAAITSVDFATSNTHNFVSGSTFYVFGITKS